jgi:hypothetical protein
MNAKERLRSMRRILAVQEQTHRLAEWKQAAARRDAAALEARREGLLAFLDGDGGLSPLFAEAAMKQLKLIEAETATALQRRESAEADVVSQARRAGVAQTMVGTAKVEAARADEREALAQAIEAMVSSGRASLP